MDIGVGRESRSDIFSVLEVMFVADPVQLGDRPLFVGGVAHGNHG